MSRSTINQQLLMNDGTGQKVPLATGTWVTQAVNIEEQNRVSLTVGFRGSGQTGYGLVGGYTGWLLVQTTNEIPLSNGCTGTPQAGAGRQPGLNGFTGAMYWQTISPSGMVAINNSTQVLQLDFGSIGANWLRVAFNPTGTTALVSNGSGTIDLYITAKNAS